MPWKDPAKLAAYKKRWKKANPLLVAAAQKRSYEKHRTERLERSRIWRNQPEVRTRRLIQMKVWGQLNRAHCSVYVKARRLRFPEMFKRYKQEENVKVRLFIQQLKCVPCFDCKVQYPHYVMHFDHRDPKQKVRNVAACGTKPKVLLEAAKCDIVCANCHAVRTWQRSQVKPGTESQGMPAEDTAAMQV